MKKEVAMRVDARGIGCPKPVMMADEALAEMSEGRVEVLVDNSASAENLERFAKKNGFFSEITREDSCWCVKIVKGYSCKISELEDKEKTYGKSLFVIIASDTMGKEEELGQLLMKAYLETMKTYEELPNMIFFLNAGVKLTTINDEAASIIREIEGLGVEIFSCGTCLKYYNLESALKVGHRGTTNHIVEGMKDFKRTVWIS